MHTVHWEIGIEFNLVVWWISTKLLNPIPPITTFVHEALAHILCCHQIKTHKLKSTKLKSVKYQNLLPPAKL